MIKCLLPLFAIWGGSTLFAQCPEVLNCTSGTDTLCDLTDNDTLLWNENFWWDPVNGSHNLTEAPAGLNLQIVDTCGGAAIRFLLYLDLDGDGFQETVVDSDDPPAAGNVRFDNAATPGHSGGTDRAFDQRPVAAAEKYRFALQQTQSGDTLTAAIGWNTDTLPASFTLPQLPLGKHRLVWMVQKAGGADTCVRNFTLRDCMPPAVICKSNLSINLLPGGLTTVWAADFLESATDNSTPGGQLIFAVREAGQGTGFPLDDMGNPAPYVVFDCCDLGENTVELWALDKAGNAGYCITTLDFQDNNGNCNPCKDPLNVCAETYWDHQNIEDVVYNLKVKSLAELFDSQNTGCAKFESVLSPEDSYCISALKDDNPLNGVSTYDLVLISKHILGIETLDAPWKILASDANRSNSLTTFDIVELRKLILGIYTKLPNQPSWRFVPGNYVFPDPANPFAALVPDTLFGIFNLPGTTAEHTFNGYKVGDVNGSAIANDLKPGMEDRSAVVLSLPDIMLEKGEAAEIALIATDAGAWAGVQLALQFDPGQIEIESLVPAGLPALDRNAWAKPRSGILTVSWFDARPHTLLPGDELFRLRLRASQAGRLSELISLSPATLAPETYAADGQPRNIQLHFGEAATPESPTVIFPPQPNPTTAGVSLPLRLENAGNVHLAVSDISGRVLFRQELLLENGAHLLDIPVTAFPQKGVYQLHISAGSIARTEKIVRH